MNNKWKRTCIPSHAVKSCIDLCTDKKVSSSAINYISHALCIMLHEVIDKAIKLMIHENKYTISESYLFSSTKGFIEMDKQLPTMWNDAKKLEVEQCCNFNKWIHYMGAIKNDVVEVMKSKPSKKIKLTRIAKNIMVSTCIYHIYKLTVLIKSCQLFADGKITQLRTIKMIYSTWMLLSGILYEDMIKFQIFIE